MTSNVICVLMYAIKKITLFSYRTSKLKTLLKKQFPELIFEQPKSCKASELVYAPGVKLADIMSNSKLDDDSDCSLVEIYINTDSSKLSHASVSLKNSIDNDKYKTPFPSSASNTTLDQFYAAGPAELFNFLAVISGLVKDIDDFSEYSSIRSDYATKLFSICQDIMTCCEGRKGILVQNLW